MEGCVLGEVGGSVCWRTFSEKPPIAPAETARVFLEEATSWLVHMGSGI